jgi:hypothetical protein
MSPLRITKDQLRQLEGGKRIRGSAPGIPVPQDALGPQDPAGYAAVHHLANKVACRRCGRLSGMLVQCSGPGSIAIGEPVCLPCGELERKHGRPFPKRSRRGKSKFAEDGPR